MPRKQVLGLVVESAGSPGEHGVGYVLKIGVNNCCVVDNKDVIFSEDGTARVRAGAPIRRVFSDPWSTNQPLVVPESFMCRFEAAHRQERALAPMELAMRVVKKTIGIPEEELRRRSRAAKKAAKEAPKQKRA